VALLHLGVVLFENEPSELKRLIASLGALERPGLTFRVTFFDNSPRPTLRAFVERHLGHEEYRWTGENWGFGATHNVGLRDAVAEGAEAYVCLNPDAVLHPRCIQELWAMGASEGTGLVEARSFPEEHPKPYDPLTGETPWCAGTILLIRREAFLATGGFDEQIFLYGEDVDLSWRTRAAGFTTRTAARALALHWVEQRALTRAREGEVFRSAAYLGRKWGAPGFARRYERLFRTVTGERLVLATPPAVPAADRRYADFAHGLRFARSRW
jgi:GT2 family glycosyltransferase